MDEGVILAEEEEVVVDERVVTDAGFPEDEKLVVDEVDEGDTVLLEGDVENVVEAEVEVSWVHDCNTVALELHCCNASLNRDVPGQE